MQKDLPIYGCIDELKNKLNNNTTVILQAPPGAGKSTALPLELLNENWLAGKKIIMLEPRRLAARSVAQRMSFLLNEEIGNTIGYRVRFDTCVSKNTRIEVVTEGILTRMLQNDNALEDIGLIIFDEFHERSLNSELSFVLCYEIQKILRSDLRILIMSATIDTAAISAIVKNAPIVKSEGKQFPLEIKYVETRGNDLDAELICNTVKKALELHSGDILAFLPGAFEIQKIYALLENTTSAVIHQLYGDLSYQLQQEAIQPNPHGKRKIVLATSIAETSLTIEGVSIVIDSGFSRNAKFDFKSGFNKLITERVTKDAADQRAGRAARLGPGVCYRMWPQTANHLLKQQRTPEILEADLSTTLLELYNWGINEVNDLNWITPPPLGNIAQAKNLLTDLNAIENGKITPIGKELLRYPTHPRFGFLFCKTKNNSLELALATDIIAILEEKDLLEKNSSANLSLRVDVLRKWRNKERVNADKKIAERIERLARQWRKLVNSKEDNTIVADEDIGKLIAAAYPERIAKKLNEKSDKYKLSNGRTAKLNSNDELQSFDYIAVAQLDGGASEGRIFSAAPLATKDILHLTKEVAVADWNEETQSIHARTEKRIGSIVLESKVKTNLTSEEKKVLWQQVITEKGISFLDLNETALQWQARILSLKAWRSTEAWPDVSDQILLDSINTWLLPYIDKFTKYSELRSVQFLDLLNTLLPWELQQKMETLAPQKITVPSGSEIMIVYFADAKAPELHVRLQEIFGWMETPSVNEGKTKLLIHLLSPGYKPVQVTQDLKSFWNTTYADVRKDLRGRYPKHSWPENPLIAEAVRGVKKRT